MLTKFEGCIDKLQCMSLLGASTPKVTRRPDFLTWNPKNPAWEEHMLCNRAVYLPSSAPDSTSQ